MISKVTGGQHRLFRGCFEALGKIFAPEEVTKQGQASLFSETLAFPEKRVLGPSLEGRKE